MRLAGVDRSIVCCGKYPKYNAATFQCSAPGTPFRWTRTVTHQPGLPGVTTKVAVSMEIVHLAAVALALTAAFSDACNNLFVRMGTDSGETYDAVFIVMVVNFLVLLPVIAIAYYPSYGLTWLSWLSFIAAGVLGTALGRALFYSGIDRIGASRTVPILSTKAIIATILGFVFLDESLTTLHAVGVLLIVGGVAVIAWETSRSNAVDTSRRELLVGVLIPIGGAIAYGAEPIVAKFGFAQGTPAPVGLVVKTAAATLGFSANLVWRGYVPRWERFDGPELRWFFLAGLTNTVFLLGFYLALELAPVNVVAPLVVSSTLFVILLSAIFMPERLERVTWKLASAAVIVVIGVYVITVSG